MSVVWNKLNLGQKYVVFVLALIAMGFISYAVVFAVLLGWMVKVSSLPRLVKYLLYAICVALAVIGTGFYYAALWDSTVPESLGRGVDFNIFSWTQGLTPRMYEGLFWFLESFHFIFFAAFFYALYRFIRYEVTPYSSLYFSSYFLVHVLYNGCPITATQNYVALRAISAPYNENLFLLTDLGQWESIARILGLVFTLTGLYVSFVQFKRLGVPPKDWLKVWRESKLEEKSE
jgi:hypothetical protein